VVAEVGQPFLTNPRALAVQFRDAFVLDDEGLKVLDVTFPDRPRAVPSATLRLVAMHDLDVARIYASVAAGQQRLVIIDIARPEAPFIDQVYKAEGHLNDTRGVKVGITNASLFAYVADGCDGLRVQQLCDDVQTLREENKKLLERPDCLEAQQASSPG
jgi:hypothetical protein